jgi:hypothetical protein
MNDLIHQSLSTIRSILDVLVDDSYRVITNPTFTTFTSGYSDTTGNNIAAGTIYDLNKISLFGLTQITGEIPVFDKKNFDARRTVLPTYNTDYASGKGIATAYTVSGAVLVAIFGNPASGTTAPTANLTYLRQPNHETTDSNTVDIPDRWVPLVIDHCTAQIFKRTTKQIPTDIEARIRVDVANISQMLHARINPQTVK